MLASLFGASPLETGFYSVLKPLISSPWFYLALVVAITATILKRPGAKGWIGEWQVNLAAKMFLDKKVYHLVRNITLPAAGGTTQIDHIIVSQYGVFVVETKNMNGWIFGTERDNQWTQSFGRRTFKFQNPLRQNYKHTRTLADMLDLPHDVMKSVIIFIGDAKLKKDVPENVITHGYIRYIRQHRDRLLSDEQVQGVVAAIAAGRLMPGAATHAMHVRNVRQIVADKETAKQRVSATPPSAQPAVQLPGPPRIAGSPPSVVAKSAMLSTDAPVVPQPTVPATSVVPLASVSPVCPRCGSPMVVRAASRGQNAGGKFWGCSTFPRCRSIVPIASPEA